MNNERKKTNANKWKPERGTQKSTVIVAVTKNHPIDKCLLV